MEDLMKRSAIKALLAATGTAACGAGLLCGSAAQAQVVARVANSSVLASTDWNNHSLDFYYQPIGSPAWSKPQQVAGPNTTTSFPAVTQIGNSTGIAVQGENDSLHYYWQQVGSSHWSAAQQVGGSGSTLGKPALAQVGKSAVIVAQGPGDVIDFYYQPWGSPTWSKPQQVTGSGSGSPAGPYGAPSVTQVGDATVIAAQGPGASLYMFWQQIGSPVWHAQKVAGAKSTYTAPSVAQVGSATVIAAGSSNTVYTYTEPIGKAVWTPEAVYDSANGVADPSIAQVGTSAVVVDTVDGVSGAGKVTTSLKAFWQAIGTHTWAQQEVTLPGPASGGSDPSVAQVGSAAVIGVALSGGNGLFYYEALGKTPWHAQSVN
jgi:hypothetical protein